MREENWMNLVNKYFPISPPTLYKVFILFMILIWVFKSGGLIQLPFVLAGFFIFILGSILAIHAKNQFKHANTPIKPEAKPTKLHIGGLYQYSRNPMYLGIGIGLTGIAISTGEMINIFFPLLYLIVMDRFFITHEERNLCKEFGEEYSRYKKTTRRWI